MRYIKKNIIKSAMLMVMLAMFSVSGYSQNNNAGSASEHLKFMDLTINGDVDKFAQQLEQRSLDISKKYYRKHKAYMLMGEFEGFRNCRVFLDHTQKTKQVYAVQVQLPNRDNWHDLNSDYEYLRNVITKQYGKPIKVVSDFNTEQFPRTDEDKYNALLQKRCIFGSMFETDYGLIIVYIDNPIDEKDVMHCHATVYYLDNLNYDSFNTEAQFGF